MILRKSTNSPPENPDEWLSAGKFAMIFGGLIGICFAGVLLGAETFFYRDFTAFGYPLAFYHRESFWNGELPLWNPFSDCGVPFLAQWNTLVLYPLSLFYLIFPLSWSLGVFCLLHLWIGGMGMYFLAYRWTGVRIAAGIAGTAFGFNGLTWYSLMWPNNIAAFAWMPWVILTVELAVNEGGRRIILAAMAGALQMLSGAPEAIVVTWVLAVAICVARVAGKGAKARMLLRIAWVAVLVAALSSAQLFPFVDLLAHSQRSSGFGDLQWSMPASGWANYLVPLFHKRLGSHGVFTQHDQYWTDSYYVGVGTVALALMAMGIARGKHAALVWTLLILSVFSVLMAVGHHAPFYLWFKSLVPQIGFMRFPIKFVIVTAITLPMAAALGTMRIMAAPENAWPRQRRRLILLGAGLVVVMSLIVWRAHSFPLPGDVFPATVTNAIVRGVFLIVILGSLVALRETTRWQRKRVLEICLLLFFWFDIFTHAPHLSPTIERNVYEADLVRINNKWENQLAAGDSRAFITPLAFQGMLMASTTNAEMDFYGHRLSLISNLNLLDHVPKVDGFFSLYIREGNDLVEWLGQLTNSSTALKDFLGVSYNSDPSNAVSWIPSESFMPMVSVGQEPLFENAATTFWRVIGENFQPRHFVVLPLEARSTVTATNQPQARVLSHQFTPQHISMDVESPGPAIVVVAQNYYHFWRAFVDGQPATLWRANHAFQALQVPTGRHSVKLVYQDRSLFVGAIVSGIALIACVVMWFRFSPTGTTATKPPSVS